MKPAPARPRWDGGGVTSPNPRLIRCALCPETWVSPGICSDVGELTLHWMERHPTEYVRSHPDAEAGLRDAGVLG